MVQAFLQAVCLDDASGYPESRCIFFRKKSKKYCRIKNLLYLCIRNRERKQQNKKYWCVSSVGQNTCLSRMGSRVRVPYAPQVYKEKLGKALIHNRIRAFFIFVWKQNMVVLRSKSGANSGPFFRDNKKAPEMYNTSLIIMFLRRIFLFLIF